MPTIKPVPGGVSLNMPAGDKTVHLYKPMTKTELLWLALRCLQAAMETDDG